MVPFAQGVELLRFDALQRRSYMTFKALMDSEEPGLFEKMRSRYHQGDHL